MKEILTTIALIVVTNWTEIGKLKTKDGKTFSVQEGKLQTNTVATLIWVDQEKKVTDLGNNNELKYTYNRRNTNEFILKSVQGPVVAENRVEITNVWINQTWITNPAWLQSHGVWQTNRTILN